MIRYCGRTGDELKFQNHSSFKGKLTKTSNNSILKLRRPSIKSAAEKTNLKSPTSKNVRNCSWSGKNIFFLLTRTIIYLNLIRRKVTITLKFSQSTAYTVSHLLGTLAMGSSDSFNFAFLRLAFHLLILCSPRLSNHFGHSA